MPHRLRLGHQEIVVVGEAIVGRHASCAFVIPGDHVSRRHARFDSQESELFVSDLQSANGVWVNGERIAAPRRLVPGDTVAIGGHAFVLVGYEPLAGRDSHETVETRPTLAGDATPPSDPDGEGQAASSTKAGNVVGLLGTVADKMLSLGQVREAERMLAGHLERIENAAVAGAPDENSVAAVGLAVRLAQASKNPSWVHYCFRLYTRLERPLPGDTVDALHDVLRTLPPIDLAVLRAYLAALRQVAPSLGPSERFVVQRIAGLERVAAAR